MESMQPRDTGPSLDPPLFRGLNDVIHRVVSKEGEQLYWDNLAEGTDEAERLEIGVTRAFPESELEEGEMVRFAVYNETGRYAVQELLRDERDTSSVPLGHVELEKDSDVARFTAIVYIFEDATAAARLDCRLISDEVLSQESEDCFEFAESIGMGSEWTRFMFRSLEGDYREEFFVELENGQARQLADFLNTLEDKV